MISPQQVSHHKLVKAKHHLTIIIHGSYFCEMFTLRYIIRYIILVYYNVKT